ncbi:hypothetical protein [Daejeonella lutea]|uniref:Uncharacterized protein n=1 Tax=Daejeonella lutea TaxID=572036 RepID=A0A1T5EDH1_9SPHI|nr:hypothetical protein [Daejeonella lutea]SKB81953.1 hypothetical protein SAMN05661099_2908 [Daejeonella lutea]
MELKEPVRKVLNKIYEPDSMIEKPFKKYHMAFKTDELGRPILLFLGKKELDGRIKGERFSRRFKTDNAGVIIKDHWEHKGKAT